MSEKRYIINIFFNSNLIWRTVSLLVDEAIPLDHPRRFASWVIRWYDLIHSIWYITPDQVTIIIMSMYVWRCLTPRTTMYTSCFTVAQWLNVFIIYKVMKYRKILSKYNAYFWKAVFHSRENIKVGNWMSSAFSIDSLEPTSEFQTPVTFLLVDKNTKCGYSFSLIARKIKMSGFAEIFTISTPAYGFSFGRHCTLCNVIIYMTQCANV